MASCNVSWVPGAHVRFGSLDFIVMTEGELARSPIAVQPLHFTSLDAIAEALEELELHAPGAHAPGSDQTRPSREDLRYLTFSFANVMTLVNKKVRWRKSSWDGRGPRKAPSWRSSLP